MQPTVIQLVGEGQLIFQALTNSKGKEIVLRYACFVSTPCPCPHCIGWFFSWLWQTIPVIKLKFVALLGKLIKPSWRLTIHFHGYSLSWRYNYRSPLRLHWAMCANLPRIPLKSLLTIAVIPLLLVTCQCAIVYDT